MRTKRWLACLMATPLILGGCGGGDAPPTATTTTVPAAATTATTMPGGEDDEEYELDVIAEAEPDEGAPPLKVQFTASVEEDEGGPWKFQWDFGDGKSSTEQNPIHTYDKIGEYTATLTVTDSRNYKGNDEIDVFVETEEDLAE